MVEVINKGFKNDLIVLIYRPPNSDIHIFINSVTSALSNINLTKYNIIFTGDFNIDLLQSNTDINILNFVNLMFSNSLVPLINKPTTNLSATLIDNFFVIIMRTFFLVF